MLFSVSAGTFVNIFVYTCVVIMCNGQHFYNINKNIETIDDIVHITERQPRILRFSKEKDNRNVDLEFRVPFGSIPVMFFKNAAQSVGRHMANSNMLSYALAAMTAVGELTKSGVSSLTHMPWKTDRHQRQRRTSGTNSYVEETSIAGMLETMQIPFNTYSKSMSNCVQKTICLLVKKSTVNAEKDDSESIDKVVDGITSLPWVLDLFADTVVKKAIDNGKNRVDCSTVYKSCFFKEKTLLGYFKGF